MGIGGGIGDRNGDEEKVYERDGEGDSEGDGEGDGEGDRGGRWGREEQDISRRVKSTYINLSFQGHADETNANQESGNIKMKRCLLCIWIQYNFKNSRSLLSFETILS